MHAQLEAGTARRDCCNFALQRMALVGVVGVQHPLGAIRLDHRDVGIGVDDVCAQHPPRKHKRAFDVADEQIDRQSAELAPVVGSRHPRLAGAKLHRFVAA